MRTSFATPNPQDIQGQAACLAVRNPAQQRGPMDAAAVQAPHEVHSRTAGPSTDCPAPAVQPDQPTLKASTTHRATGPPGAHSRPEVIANCDKIPLLPPSPQQGQATSLAQRWSPELVQARRQRSAGLA